MRQVSSPKSTSELGSAPKHRTQSLEWLLWELNGVLKIKSASFELERF